MLIAGLAGLIISSISGSKENDKRLDRLKELGNQARYSFTKVADYDKELKRVSLSITDLMSNLGSISREMGSMLEAFKNILNGFDVTKFRQTLDWIDNFSDHAF
jgi:hypothetical protein